MYPNLNAEMARRGITVKTLSERTDIPYGTLAPKVRGDKPIMISEATKIRDAIDRNLTIDTLFSESMEQV